MKPEPEDERISKLYREILSEGMNPAELRAEKKAFISLYFPKKPFFVFRPVVWTPAMAFAVAAFAIFVVRPELFMTSSSPRTATDAAPVSSEVSAPAAPQSAAALPVSAAAAPLSVPQDQKNIAIQHLSSEVGTTVVYQKNVENVPVAVVWVFPRPETA